MRFVRVDQIARRFEMGRTASYRRVSVLRDAGMLRMSPPLWGEGPGVVLITQRGMSGIDCNLTLPRVDVRQFEHDLELVEIATDYELQGARVYSDREIRSLGKQTGKYETSFRFEVGPQFAYGRRRFHYPDLIVNTNGRRLAIEVEIAEKSMTRLREILRGYGMASGIDEVLYVCPRPVVARRIEQLTYELHVYRNVRVESRGETPA